MTPIRFPHPPDPNAERPALRSVEEIQRAHDVLWSQVNGTAPFVIDAARAMLAAAVLDVMCWALQHPHADYVGTMIDTIEDRLRAQGWTFHTRRPAPTNNGGPHT